MMEMVDISRMKVVRENPLLSGEKAQTSLRLTKVLMEQIDKIAAEQSSTRTEIIEAILVQALNDPKFVLKL